MPGISTINAFGVTYDLISDYKYSLVVEPQSGGTYHVWIKDRGTGLAVIDPLTQEDTQNLYDYSPLLLEMISSNSQVMPDLTLYPIDREFRWDYGVFGTIVLDVNSSNTRLLLYQTKSVTKGVSVSGSELVVSNANLIVGAVMDSNPLVIYQFGSNPQN